MLLAGFQLAELRELAVKKGPENDDLLARAIA